jgi:hypothetical protein
MSEYSEFFAFRKMITPMVIQIIFWIGVALSVIGGIGMIIGGASSNVGGGMLVLMGLLYILIGPLVVRIYCELLIVMFRILDELKGIRAVFTPPAPGVPVPPAAAPPVR